MTNSRFLQFVSFLVPAVRRLREERDRLFQEQETWARERDLIKTDISTLRAPAELTGSRTEKSRNVPTGPLIFLHMAKTGGATLGSVLTRQYPLDQILSLDPGVSNSALGVWPFDDVSRQIAGMTEPKKTNIRLVPGHFMFGIHRLLPNNPRYVTILRHPVDRVISSYYYILTQPGIPVRQKILEQGLDLEGYARSGIGLDSHNYQTRVLAGLPEYDATWENVEAVHREPLPRSALELAKRNIDEHFLLAGCTEKFDEFLLVLKLIQEWPLANIFYKRINETPGRPTASEVTQSTVRLIEKYNELDIELYEYVRGRFDGQRARWKAQLDYLLRRFKPLNALHAVDSECRGELGPILANVAEQVDRGLSTLNA